MGSAAAAGQGSDGPEDLTSGSIGFSKMFDSPAELAKSKEEYVPPLARRSWVAVTTMTSDAATGLRLGFLIPISGPHEPHYASAAPAIAQVRHLDAGSSRRPRPEPGSAP